jgi:hypothetical protein
MILPPPLIARPAASLHLKRFHIDGLVRIPLTKVIEPCLPQNLLPLLLKPGFNGIVPHLIDGIVALLLLHLKQQTLPQVLTLQIVQFTLELVIGSVALALKVGNVVRPTNQRVVHQLIQ